MNDLNKLGWIAVSFQIISLGLQMVFNNNYFLIFNLIFFIIALISFHSSKRFSTREK